MSDLKTYRVVNISHFQNSPGRFLDTGPQHGSKLIGAGRAYNFNAISYDALPDFVRNWVDKGWAKVLDATNGRVVGGQDEDALATGELRRGVVSPVGDVLTKSKYDNIDEDEPDLSDAIPAHMPGTSVGAHMPSIRQEQSRVKISLGLESEQLDSDDGLSPIPGDRPVSVDDSAKFTIKAPRSHGVGSVIK